MSKSRGNTVSPFELFDKYGADATRWYLLSVSPAWTPTKIRRGRPDRCSQQILRNAEERVQLLRALFKSGRDRPCRLKCRLMARGLSWTDGFSANTTSLIGDVTEYMDQYDHMRDRAEPSTILSTKTFPTGISAAPEEDSMRKN